MWPIDGRTSCNAPPGSTKGVWLTPHAVTELSGWSQLGPHHRGSRARNTAEPEILGQELRLYLSLRPEDSGSS